MAMATILPTFLAAGQAGLALIGRAVLPVLFPFFVLTSLILNLTPTRNRWLIAGLAYFSGYPNGTRLTKNLYDQGLLSVREAHHLCILTSTPSPFFLIATVGTLFLQNTGYGFLIFICAVIAAIINAWLWRPAPHHEQAVSPTTPLSPRMSFFTAFSQALTSATSAILNVCGVILFFYILAQMLHLPAWLAGILEMTTGVAGTTNLLLIEFLVCLGGLSVALQNFLFTDKLQIKFGYYLGYKLTHAVIACGLLAICLFFF